MAQSEQPRESERDRERGGEPIPKVPSTPPGGHFGAGWGGQRGRVSEPQLGKPERRHYPSDVDEVTDTDMGD